MVNGKKIEIINPVDYNELLQRAVAVMEKARISIARSIADNVSNAHWEIGKLLQERKLDSKHGVGVVERLSIDLKQRYPKMGLSPRSLWLMKKFYCRFCDSALKLQQAVAVLSCLNPYCLQSYEPFLKTYHLKNKTSTIFSYSKDFLLKSLLHQEIHFVNRDLTALHFLFPFFFKSRYYGLHLFESTM